MTQQTLPIPFPMAPYIFLTEETTIDDLARYCADIKQCGFNCVRTGNGPAYLAEDQIDYTVTDLFFAAADSADLFVFPHFQMSYRDWMGQAPYNIDPETCLVDDEYHRLLDKFYTATVSHYRDHPRLLAWVGIGEPGDPPPALWQHPRFLNAYKTWLIEQYKTIEDCERAWGLGSRLEPRTGQPADVDTWNPLAFRDEAIFKKYRPQRDLQRFKTEFLLEKMTTCERATMRTDRVHPLVTGIHNVLTNPAAKGWDFELQSSRADGLMSSIHNCWHSGLADYEFFLSSYVQARLTRDYAKGRWAIPYETTGGPNFRGADHGFNMRPAEQSQMTLAYLAAGLQGGGFWTWNARLTGYEAGEYAMTTLQGVPSSRARILGSFAQRMEHLKAELTVSEPDRHAAVLMSWENDMFCSVDYLTHSEGMRRDSGSRNRIGAARALTNANVPWEFVTDNELIAGLVDSYPVLIAPSMPLVTDATLAAMERYVGRGGTLIADMSFGLFDENGRIRTAGAGGALDRLLGAYPTDVLHSFQEPLTIRAPGSTIPRDVSGNFCELAVTNATIEAVFNDGRPAIVGNKIGDGRVVFFAFEVALRCAQRGNTDYEALLVEPVAASQTIRWECDGVKAFRRRVSNVDYYYLINEGAEIEVEVRAHDCVYAQVTDVVQASELAVNPYARGCSFRVPIGAELGSWLRCVRR